jgi:hypothetical protein
MSENSGKSLTALEAQRLEYSIIGLCVLALAFIFQPFSQLLFSIGCIGVVVGGLIFNLMPMCVAGSSYAKIAKTGLIVAIIFAVVVFLALASAWMYGIYLRAGG